MKQKVVLLGMSGGVDSSVAALLLKRQGYKVIGVFMKNFSDTKDPLTGECHWQEDKKMAQKIALKLKIPFIVLNFEKLYKEKIIKPMFQSYKLGFTPNPDISCNSLIKFPLLWKEAKKLKCNYIATGHYARIRKTSSGFQLLAGKDKSKDQSYFLAELSQSDLQHTLFPLGNLIKSQVRKIAKTNNFPNWNKHGTAGICFIGNINFHQFLENRIKAKPGKVITPEGSVIGAHQGLAYYTTGQKAGSHIGINIEKPPYLAQKRFYVAEKRKNNVLVVAPESHSILKKREVIIKSLYLINTKEKIPPSNLSARIRHLGSFHKGKLTKKSNKYHFVFQKPVEAIAPGQFIVLYHKDKVIGSGEIRLK